jgi:plastocyanin
MRRIVALLAVALLVAGCGSGEPDALFGDDGSAAAPDYSYTIPAGTGEAIDRGDSVDILPRELDVRVGEVLELINLDSRGHLVGPFFVGKGETLRQRFNAPGTFIGECSVHDSGEIVLTVAE